MVKMQKKSNRSERVASEIKKILSEFFISDSHDYGDFKLKFFSITDVITSSCLQNAHVYVTYLQKNIEDDAVLEFLSLITPKLRHQLGDHLRLKFVPDLKFSIDKTLEYAAKIDALIEKTHQN